MLSVQRLVIFREVVGRGSFSAAANALSYSQSAVSQSVATLEAELGVTLIKRDRRRTRATAAGAALLDHTEAVLARLEAAEAEVAEIAGLRSGRMRIASFPSAGATLMPLAIASFRAAHPGVSVSFAEGEPSEVMPRLQAGEFDLALVYEFSGVRATPASGIRRVRLIEDPMHVVMPADHALAARSTLRLTDLAGESWVQTSTSTPCARHVVRMCHAAGFEPSVAFESDDYQTVQGLVAAGLGVALVPHLALSSVREDIIVRPLRAPAPVRAILAATSRDDAVTPAVATMLNVLRTSARRYQHAVP
jgi:DNA-binding transcriptional LysR family regulator